MFLRLLGNPAVGQGETSDLQQNHHEPKQGDEPTDAFPEGENLLLQLQHVLMGHIDRHHLGLSCVDPTASSGSRHTAFESQLDVASRSDKVAKTMVVFALRSCCGNHYIMITIATWQSQCQRENSRKNVWNAVTDSTAGRHNHERSTIDGVTQLSRGSSKYPFGQDCK